MTIAAHHTPDPSCQRRGDWCQTFTGRKIHPLDPRPEDFHIEDIAHALSLIPRFGGHTKPTQAYSVAQHCVLASRSVSAPAKLLALLHDAAEAYIGDVPRPLKRHMVFQVDDRIVPFGHVESAIMDCVFRRFDVPVSLLSVAEVKAIDESLLVTEARDLMAPLHPDWSLEWLKGRTPLPVTISPWPSSLAKERFLSAFRELYRGE